MKPHPEMIEGPEAYRRFKATMRIVLAVPHSQIQKRIEEHREEAAKNPNKRGPKPKNQGVSADAVQKPARPATPRSRAR